MTDLERQCDEIHKKFYESDFVKSKLQQFAEAEPGFREWLLGDRCNADLDKVDTLLRYIAELRRPSDAKEIAQIQERHAEDMRMLEKYPDLLTNDDTMENWQSPNDIRTLLHALAESQRDNARWVNAHSNWQAELERVREDGRRQVEWLTKDRDQWKRAAERASALTQHQTLPPIEDVQTGLESQVWDLLNQRNFERQKVELINTALQSAESRVRQLESLLGEMQLPLLAKYADEIEKQGYSDRVSFYLQTEFIRRLRDALASPLPADTRDEQIRALTEALKLVVLVLGTSDVVLSLEQQAKVDDALAQPQADKPKVNCEKCGGYGWLRGSELDNPSEDTYADTMTKYACDGDAHKTQAEQLPCTQCDDPDCPVNQEGEQQ